MRTWEAKIIVHSYYKFTNQFIIEEVTFSLEENLNYATLNLEANSIEAAEEIALRKVNYILKVLKFVLNSDFNCSIYSVNETTKGDKLKEGFTEIKASLAVIKDFPTDKLDEINFILENYKNSDSVGKAAFDFFIDGFGVKDYNNESFINFFKSIEIISNEYVDEAKEEKTLEVKQELHTLIKKLEKAIYNMHDKKINSLVKQIYSLGFIEAKRKLRLVLRNLGLNEYDEQIGELPTLRNDVAHGKVKYDPVTNEQLNICKEIAKNVITRYLDKNRI